MAKSYEILGQSAPASTTLTTLYTVPTNTQTVISAVAICNRSTSSIAFRLSAVVSGTTTDDASDYLYWDLPVPGNDTFNTMSVTLGTSGDTLKAYIASTGLSFTVFGSEVT